MFANRCDIFTINPAMMSNIGYVFQKFHINNEIMMVKTIIHKVLWKQANENLVEQKYLFESCTKLKSRSS